MATQTQVIDYATSLGLPVCIAQLYADEHGGALPVTAPDLCRWANDTGRRSVPEGASEAVWACTPAPNAAGFEGFKAWVVANPWLALVLAAFAGSVLFGRRRRR